MPTVSPENAWQALSEGNERFVTGTPAHPNRSAQHRAALAAGQHPIAAVFGCGDSRVPVEIVFDQGLGDLFVVRTAGHVLDSAVLGSLEYATTVLEVPLIVVLGHDGCGAIKATLSAIDDGVMPGGYLRELVERITPSVLSGRRSGLREAAELEAHHVRETAAQLLSRSNPISQRVASGRLGILGATYRLDDGRVLAGQSSVNNASS